MMDYKKNLTSADRRRTGRAEQNRNLKYLAADRDVLVSLLLLRMLLQQHGRSQQSPDRNPCSQSD
jgi:hypothetical protein